jgi:hypothetical protein
MGSDRGVKQKEETFRSGYHIDVANVTGFEKRLRMKL